MFVFRLEHFVSKLKVVICFSFNGMPVACVVTRLAVKRPLLTEVRVGRAVCVGRHSVAKCTTSQTRNLFNFAHFLSRLVSTVS